MAIEIVNSGHDFIELDTVTKTFKRHAIQFSQAGTHMIKLTKDARGKETPTFIIQKRLVKLDAAGEILEEKKGFDMDREVTGIIPDGSVEINESEIPIDYVGDDGKIQYKYNKTTKKLENK